MLARTFRQMLIISEKNVRDPRAIWQVLWQGFRMPPFAAEDLNLSISRSGVVLGTDSDSGHGHSFLDDVSQIVVPFGSISVGRDQHRHLGVVEDVVGDRAEHG